MVRLTPPKNDDGALLSIAVRNRSIPWKSVVSQACLIDCFIDLRAQRNYWAVIRVNLVTSSFISTNRKTPKTKQLRSALTRSIPRTVR